MKSKRNRGLMIVPFRSYERRMQTQSQPASLPVLAIQLNHVGDGVQTNGTLLQLLLGGNREWFSALTTPSAKYGWDSSTP